MSPLTNDHFEPVWAEYRTMVDNYLSVRLPAGQEPGAAQSLDEALRYSAEGGKRIRPVLALAACECVGGQAQRCIAGACAIELFHAFSLVHDDLPLLDNDVERRGRPTAHVRFGAGAALLAGDALLVLGFELLALDQAKYTEPKVIVDAVARCCRALGKSGMVGGQYDELKVGSPTLAELERVQSMKTGALLAVSLEVGALLGGGAPEQVQTLSAFGHAVGRCYQLIDDILDGKQDGGRDNVNVLSFLSEQEARRAARLQHERALNLISTFGERGTFLAAAAERLLDREY